MKTTDANFTRSISTAIICLAVWCLGLQTAAAQYDTRGSGYQAKLPNIMVVPYINEQTDVSPSDLRAHIDASPMLQLALSKVKESFSLNGYPTVDFIGLLRSQRNTDMAQAYRGATTNPIIKMMQSSKADIFVYVTPRIIRDGSTSQAIVMLDAQDAYTRESFANANFTSDSFMTSDTVRLVSMALDNISRNFFGQIEERFADLVASGRTIVAHLYVKEGCEMSFYDSFGETGDDLGTLLNYYLAENAYHGTGEVNSIEDYYIDMSFKIPIYEESSGRPIPKTYAMSMLRKFLRGVLPAEYKIGKTDTNGAQIDIYIEDNAEL